MTLYLTLDARNGMQFNGRRQSRDSAVLEDIRNSIPEELTIDPFSEKLIQRAQIPYRLAEGKLLPGTHFFLEDRTGALAQQASRVVIYRWNRHYPADRYFDANLAALGFSLVETGEFPGSSHETITKEVYVR